MALKGAAVMKRRSYDQCVRCGKTVMYGRSVCRECNPAGLPEPSPAQYHATVFAAVLVALVVLGVVAFILH
jgi:uncharacterized OB-fold protein